MPSEKFRITTNGQSLRNPNNTFFGKKNPFFFVLSFILNVSHFRHDIISQPDFR